ncbi:TetR/AcrR family transcriptional regulator [Sphingobium sp. CFD-2]|uniref:TetR/AcrR family transcriptional regulator n=1 Tax=Sphingobium sp. CFD-2 TaxID=2878542 RepID=UPI00214B2CC2|nr:TetR/AcrR family transcriptional regulator [Sphingobium sp. CFD-2]
MQTGQTGRSPRADGNATRARILESAGQLYGAQGYAETKNKAIAEHAGVDLASINYYFGSRDGLYRAVVVEAHRRFIGLEDLVDIYRSNIPAREKLHMLIGMIARRFSGAAHWSSEVLARELLSPSPHLAVLDEQELPPKLGIVLQILADITRIPVEDPRLLCCLVSVAAPCATLLIAGRGSPTLGRELRRIAPAAIVDHLFRFACGGLDAISSIQVCFEEGASNKGVAHEVEETSHG